MRASVASLPLADPAARRRALLFLLAASLLWSLGGALIKSVPMSGLAVAGGRCLFSAIFFLLFLRRLPLRVSAGQWAAAAAFAATMISFVLATKMTTAANAILLQYTAPVFVAVLAPRMLGERARWFDWAAIGATMVGMALFFCDQVSFEGMAGNLTAILSGLFFALVPMLLRRMQGDRQVCILLGSLLTFLVCLPSFALEVGSATGRDWLYLALLGLFQIGLAYALFAAAMSQVSAIEAVLVPLLEPILNPLWVFLLLGERPGRFALLGGAIVLAAVALRSVAILRSFPSAPYRKE
jgi:drug/metabolite transporter (DMT)-like permease